MKQSAQRKICGGKHKVIDLCALWLTQVKAAGLVLAYDLLGHITL